MDLSRFVCVIHDDDPSRGGTGYLLHGTRVLTARHVVEGVDRLSIVYSGPVDADPHRAVVLRVLWQGEGDLDIAVLKVETGLRIARQHFEPDADGRDRPWRSRGWAVAGSTEPPNRGRVSAALSALAGTAYGFEAGARAFEVKVEAAPAGVKWWEGVSGAPVFCRNVAGVIRGGQEPYEGRRLLAIPIAAVWGDASFRAAIGDDDGGPSGPGENRRRRRAELLADLTAILEKYLDTASAIADQRSEWRVALERPGGSALRLAEVLCTARNWRDVLRALHAAQEALRGGTTPGGATAATGVLEVLYRALPEVYASTALQVTSIGAGGELVTLPIETTTLAELAMAAYDGRELAYLNPPSPSRYPRGRALVDPDHERRQRGEVGFDFRGDDTFRAWLIELARAIGLEPDDISAASRPDRLPDLVRLVNDRIDRDVKLFGEPRRYFAFRSDFATRHRSFLERVSRELNALHLVELTSETLAEERSDADFLLAILLHGSPAKRRK